MSICLPDVLHIQLTRFQGSGNLSVKRKLNRGYTMHCFHEKRIIIAESRPPETRFPLDGASDADIGVNSALTYRVDPNDYFTLDTQSSREQMSSLSLVLRKSLDREEIQEHSLLLTASDGGKPELTSTVQLLITILDVNDNAPEFDQLIYKVRMLENSLNGSLVIELNATDPDDGTNADITYSFRRPVSPAILYAFYINPDSGEIRTKGKLDFEENKYDLNKLVLTGPGDYNNELSLDDNGKFEEEDLVPGIYILKIEESGE